MKGMKETEMQSVYPYIKIMEVMSDMGANKGNNEPAQPDLSWIPGLISAVLQSQHHRQPADTSNKIIQEPVLDENGEPVLDPNGEVLYRNIVPKPEHSARGERGEESETVRVLREEVNALRAKQEEAKEERYSRDRQALEAKLMDLEERLGEYQDELRDAKGGDPPEFRDKRDRREFTREAGKELLDRFEHNIDPLMSQIAESMRQNNLLNLAYLEREEIIPPGTVQKMSRPGELSLEEAKQARDKLKRARNKSGKERGGKK